MLTKSQKEAVQAQFNEYKAKLEKDVKEATNNALLDLYVYSVSTTSGELYDEYDIIQNEVYDKELRRRLTESGFLKAEKVYGIEEEPIITSNGKLQIYEGGVLVGEQG